MQLAERFSKVSTSRLFNQSQLLEMLAFPAGDEEKFIAEKAAAGTPVEDMTVKKLRAEIKDWKKKAAEKETEAEKLKKENEELKKDNAFKLEVNRSNAEEYFKLRAEKEKEISELQDKINELQKQLENPTVEILPADDEEKENLRKEVAALKAREENFREEIATSQALNQFFMMANFLQEHQNCLPEVIKGYVETDGVTAERINQIAFVSALLKKILNEENSGNKKS